MTKSFGGSEKAEPDPCVVVIFGASGDLTSRKLLPALRNLQQQRFIPDATSILGTSRTPPATNDLRFVPGDITEGQLWRELGDELDKIDRQAGTGGNRVWYLATLPRFFGTIAEGIGKSGLIDTGGWHRLVVEKPFGADLASARELNATLSSYFSEDQIYRIDHYLGKETVQNLLVFRFANAIFEPIWNRRYVDHVQITVGEDIGVEDRAAFYEQTGALRDVGQNHLMQLLALICMEPPVAWDATAIRNEKVQVLKAVRRFTPEECQTCVARGQYEGYTSEENVAADSATETFVALKLAIDNWRWAGVPFYIRTGKKLGSKATEVAIHFQRVPHLLFEKTDVEHLEPNVLTIRVQPNEGISLSFGSKVPGPDVKVKTVDMDFDYETDFGSGTPEAYERLLMDAMNGDATLFTRADEIEEAWGIVDPIIEHWRSGGKPEHYDAGSWGPPSSDELIERDGRAWRVPQHDD